MVSGTSDFGLEESVCSISGIGLVATTGSLIVAFFPHEKKQKVVNAKTNG